MKRGGGEEEEGAGRRREEEREKLKVLGVIKITKYRKKYAAMCWQQSSGCGKS